MADDWQPTTVVLASPYGPVALPVWAATTGRAVLVARMLLGAALRDLAVLEEDDE